MRVLLPISNYITKPHDSALYGWLLTTAWTRRDLGERLRPYQWAIDNRCYIEGNAFDFDTYLELLHRARDYGGRCLFAVVPDVVGDAAATHTRWEHYAPAMRRVGLPLAYVAQDSLDELPDVGFDALFIGGTTEYKLGQVAARLMREARALGKHVHMGRVNTLKRLTHAYKAGADTVDGTAWSIVRDRQMRMATPHLRWLQRQLPLFREVV